MNIHSSLDILTAAIGSTVIGNRKYFTESVESQPIGDVIRESHPGELTLEQSGIHDIPITTPVGSLTTAYSVWHWDGRESPTILYHHGNNEDPFETGRFASHSFRTIFHGHRDDFDANIIAVRAPFHTLSTRAFAERMGVLENFTSMLAASVVGIESLRRQIRDQWNSTTVISGFSLGGWVTNLHRAYCQNARAYAPLFAGGALGDLFVESAYRRMVSPTAIENTSVLRDILDFDEDIGKTDSDTTVRALLGRYDQFIQLEPQRECYEPDQLTIVPKGHITGILAGDRLRAHLDDVLTTL